MKEESTEGSLQEALMRIRNIHSATVNGEKVEDARVLGTFNFNPYFDTAYVFSQTNKPKIGTMDKRAVSKWNTVNMLLVSSIAFVASFIKRPAALVYSVDRVSSEDRDHDFRMDTVYAFLRANHVSFLEVLHTLVHQNFRSNLRIRKRYAIYAQAIEVISKALALVSYSHNHQPKIEGDPEIVHAVTHRVKSSIEIGIAIRIWKVVLRLLKPRVLLMIDDMRHSLVITAAAELLDIPTYWVQHGHYTKYHLGYLGDEESHPPMPTGVLVWSEYWKIELRKLGTYIPDDRILVAGFKEPLPELVSGPRTQQRALGVLLPYEAVANKDEVKVYIAELLQDEAVTIYFKVRKDMSYDQQLQEYGLKVSSQIICIDDHRIHLDSIDVVIGTYSTYLYDMIPYGIPVVQLVTTSEYGERMSENGLATQVARTCKEGVVEQVRRAAGISQVEREKRRTQLVGMHPGLLTNTLTEIFKDAGILNESHV